MLKVSLPITIRFIESKTIELMLSNKSIDKSHNVLLFEGKYFHQTSPKKAAFGSSVEGKSVSNEVPNTSQANSPYNLR